MKRLAAAVAALSLGTPLGLLTLTPPSAAIALPTGMVLGGQVEPASSLAVVKSVSIAAQDGEKGTASLATSQHKSYFSYAFKVVGPGTVSWKVTTNLGSFSGSVATGKVNLSKSGGMVREWNLCQAACSEPVAQPMSH